MTGVAAGLSVSSCASEKSCFLCSVCDCVLVQFCKAVTLASPMFGRSPLWTVCYEMQTGSVKEEERGAKLERSSVESVRVTAAGFGE